MIVDITLGRVIFFLLGVSLTSLFVIILILFKPYVVKYLLMDKRHRELINQIRLQEKQGKSMFYVTKEDVEELLGGKR